MTALFFFLFFFLPSRPAFALLVFHPSICLLLLLFFVAVAQCFSLAASSCPLIVCGTGIGETETERYRSELLVRDLSI